MICTVNLFDPKCGTRNTERDIPPFSRTPTSKIHVFCNQHQVGGRLSRPVTSQTMNTERGTRNPERDFPPFSRTPTSKIHVFCNQHQVGGRLSKTRNLSYPKRGTRNAERGTRNTEPGTVYLHPLVALPHLRFTFSAINTKWEGDFQGQ